MEYCELPWARMARTAFSMVANNSVGSGAYVHHDVVSNTIMNGCSPGTNIAAADDQDDDNGLDDAQSHFTTSSEHGLIDKRRSQETASGQKRSRSSFGDDTDSLYGVRAKRTKSERTYRRPSRIITLRFELDKIALALKTSYMMQPSIEQVATRQIRRRHLHWAHPSSRRRNWKHGLQERWSHPKMPGVDSPLEHLLS
jgi:hypothetical protein